MEIYGYSERGAMNALFYEMSFKDEQSAEKDLHEFLRTAGIEKPEQYESFELYTESSLSEFGSPDLVIFANHKVTNNKVVFFVEAKASCCKSYDLEGQKKRHETYIKQGKYDNGHASNLFFQMRLKEYFFKWIKAGEPKNRSSIKDDPHKRIEESNGRGRSYGDNVIVKKFVCLFKNVQEAHYIAIIPEQSIERIEPDSTYGFLIHFVTWKQLKEKFSEYKLLQKTLNFNQVNISTRKGLKTKSQILNNIS